MMVFLFLVEFITWNNMIPAEQSEKRIALIIFVSILIFIIGLVLLQYFYFQKNSQIKVQTLNETEAVATDQTANTNKITLVKINNFKEEFVKIKEELLNSRNFQDLNDVDVVWPPQDIEAEKNQRENPFDANQAVQSGSVEIQ